MNILKKESYQQLSIIMKMFQNIKDYINNLSYLICLKLVGTLNYVKIIPLSIICVKNYRYLLYSVYH